MKAPHADHFLHGHVGVVKVGALLMQRELVLKTTARSDGILADAGTAVHGDRYLESVPVHGGRLGQVVIDNNSHPITLCDLDGRPRAASVVAPQVDRFVRPNGLLHRFSHQVKHLDAVVHLPWKIRHVRRLNRQERSA